MLKNGIGEEENEIEEIGHGVGITAVRNGQQSSPGNETEIDQPNDGKNDGRFGKSPLSQPLMRSTNKRTIDHDPEYLLDNGSKFIFILITFCISYSTNFYH